MTRPVLVDTAPAWIELIVAAYLEQEAAKEGKTADHDDKGAR